MDLIGTTLGNYYIIQELGRGGMAVVYLAEEQDSPDVRRVAIKVLMPEAAQRLDVLRRFRREAELYDKLRHPRIVYSYGLEENDGYIYLVLDYMEGGSLSRRIKREGRLSWDESLRIIRQIAEALSFAHSRGIVHRDVKPSNILFDGRGDAYLSDFGVAHDAEATTLTAVGVQPGTYHYMAPEQVKGLKVDGRADQFALATVFYQMICGYLPFSASDTFALAHQIVNESPALLPPDLEAPYGVASVLNRAHAKDPNDRYPDILEFVNALERLSVEEPVTSQPPLIPKTKPHRPKKLRWGAALGQWGKLAAVAALALAVLFVGIKFLPGLVHGDNDRPTPMAPLTKQANSTSSASRSHETPLPTSTETTPSGGMIVIADATDTPEPKPTDTPTVQQTQITIPTLVPTKSSESASASSKQKPASTKAVSPTSPSPTPVSGSVVLLSPAPGASLKGRVTFSWRPTFELGPGEGYELAFWKPGQDPMTQAQSPVGSSPDTSKQFNIEKSFLTPGEWEWGVFLVKLSPWQRIKLISEKRQVTISSGSNGQTFTSPPPWEKQGNKTKIYHFLTTNIAVRCNHVYRDTNHFG